MDKITPTDPESHSGDLFAANIAKLKELFPEVVAEGKVDFNALQEILGNEVETGDEFYRFTWAGKAQARREAHKPSTGTLRPAPEESVDWDKTKNLYIEGDNLEVLKLLQKSYGGKVKMIYIDPPYNTGKDFVYKDNYRDNLRNYKEQTGQVDSEGNTLSTNSDTDGRYHSNWLNMMYPRLRLARNLLQEAGLIFISIDDNEVDNLVKVSNEIFGASNLINQFVWKKNSSGKTVSREFPVNIEYLLMYSRSEMFSLNNVYKPLAQSTIDSYSKDDGDGRGKYCTVSLQKTKSPGPETTYDYTDNNGNVWSCPAKGWRLIQSKVKALENDGRLYFEGQTLREKRYWDERESEGQVADTLWDDLDEGNIGTAELKKLFDQHLFDNPKPTDLIMRCLRIALSKSSNDVVLDFFSGSATTAHAVMQLNAEDGGQRQHIQVQLPEPTDAKSEAYKAGYTTIAEIGKERIRRAGKKIVRELEAGIKALEAKAVRTEEEEQELKEKKERLAKLDIGFRVFKLDSSNISAWDGDPERMQENLLSAAENIKPDRTEADVLYEVLLKYGLDLTLPIDERTIAGRKVYNVGMGALFLCLAETITNVVAEGIGKWKEELKPETCRVIFRDNGFTDVEKTNAVQTLKRYGVTEVRSV